MYSEEHQTNPHVKLMPLLLSLALVVASLGAVACGTGKPSGPDSRPSTRDRTSTAATSQGPASEAQPADRRPHAAATSTAQKRAPVFDLRARNDNDADGTLSSHGLDLDDDYIARFGPTASSTDRAAIAALVGRYFSALAHGEDSRACSLMFLGLENLVAETYSQVSPNQAAGKGMTCATVLSKVFAGHNDELSEESRRLRVVAVRTRGFSALAVLRFGPKAVRRIALYREGGAWRIGTLQATSLG